MRLVTGHWRKAAQEIERPRQGGRETTAEMIARVRLEQRRRAGCETVAEIVARCEAARQKTAAGHPATAKPAAPAAPRLQLSAAQLEAVALAWREAEVEKGFALVREAMRARGEL